MMTGTFFREFSLNPCIFRNIAHRTLQAILKEKTFNIIRWRLDGFFYGLFIIIELLAFILVPSETCASLTMAAIMGTSLTAITKSINLSSLLM